MNNKERIELLKAYILDDPEDAFSKYALALEYIKSNADEQAESEMRELFSQHPGYLPNYYHYGKLLERKNEFTAAAEIYEAGIALARSTGDHHTLNELRGALDNLE